MGLKIGLITSWAAFKDLQILGCTLKLHTPCEQTTGMVVTSEPALSGRSSRRTRPRFILEAVRQ